MAYLRVSTAGQGRSGLSLEGQREAVVQYATSAGGRIMAEFVETESGRKNDRPKLAEALAACRKRHATLVIAKLDRLSRDAAFLLKLRDEGVDFIAADMPNANRLTVGIMALVAEAEAEMASARTKAALAAAKARGVKLGGKRERHGDLRPHATGGGKASGDARRKVANRQAADLAPIICDLYAGSGTLAAVAAGLNERGLTTARGKKWTAVQVSRVKARIEEEVG
uniref:recombinase family protein n=1 Tax=Belnapia rosea TaxID=938405 RepID=UPI000B8759F6|nr:recombinase family protein [Belnapia rosea]